MPSLIAFDFWGAGNTGDDLMLAGFLAARERLGGRFGGPLSALCAFDAASQRRRFPEVAWIEAGEAAARRLALSSAGKILGVGGTPFQLSGGGDWFLRKLEDIAAAARAGAEIVFVNVGAESEIEPKAAAFAMALAGVSHCSARDGFSLTILRGLSTPARLSLGGDLAHLSLERLAAAVWPERVFPLGIVLGADTLEAPDLAAAAEYLTSAARPVAFITGDCRGGPGFETARFTAWTRSWFSPLRRALVLRRPDYRHGDLAELARPIAECETVLSARYHGLLQAAWFGCRVAALGRTSKVEALARELGVPCLRPPFTAQSLRRLEREAVVVARSRLEALRDAALAGVEACGP